MVLASSRFFSSCEFGVSRCFLIIVPSQPAETETAAKSVARPVPPFPESLRFETRPVKLSRLKPAAVSPSGGIVPDLFSRFKRGLSIPTPMHRNAPCSAAIVRESRLSAVIPATFASERDDRKCLML